MTLDKNKLNHLSSQLLRSSTSVALNYGEVQGAKSLTAERNRNNKELKIKIRNNK